MDTSGLTGVDACPALAIADAGSSGCTPGTPGMICGPSGCNSLCATTDYEMTCKGTEMSASIPEPAASLGCQVIPIPTPSGALFYCCPCEP